MSPGAHASSRRSSAEAVWVRHRIRLTTSQWPKFLVMGVMERGDIASDGSVFAVVELTPERNRNILTQAMDVAKSRHQRTPKVVEYSDDVAPAHFWRMGDERAEDYEEYADTLQVIENRDALYMLLDTDPLELELGCDWRLVEGEVVIRYDCRCAAVNWEIYQDTGTILTALDVSLESLWRMMGGVQGFYYPALIGGYPAYRERWAGRGIA